MIERSIYVEHDFQQRATALLALFLPRCRFTAGGEESTVVAVRAEMPSEEAYSLKIEENKALIRYQTTAGLRNALATLSLKAYERDGALFFEDCDLDDAPALGYRGAMLDLARGVMPIERLKTDMILIAKSKFNVLHLHLADSKGVAVELDCLDPAYRLEGYYTKGQVRELIAFAELLGLELIPEFDMPAHSTRLVEFYPRLACKTDLQEQCKWTICGGNEETYLLYRAVIREMSKLFESSRYFHIGGDELEFSDSGRPCHWQECKTCQARMKQEGLADRQELYYYFINRINGYVKECGKRTVMWSDQIDCTRPKGLDDDILMQFWRVAGKGRGPHEGCSFEGQLRLGYQFINSHYPNTYVDIEKYANPQKLASWRWDTVPEEYRDQIIGSEVCAWEYGNRAEYTHYDYSLPSAIVLFGEKFWDGKTEGFGKEAEIAVTRAVLGAATPEGFNVFEAIGSIMPRKKENSQAQYVPCYLENVTADEAKLDEIIKILSDRSLFTDGDRLRAGFYKECAEYTKAGKL